MSGIAKVLASCSRCADLLSTVSIESPTAVENILKVVRDSLADGTIVEVEQWPPGKVRFAQPPFLTIQPAGPWPDLLLFFFSCTACGRTFRLSVETYHGSGGSWSPCPVTER